MLALLLLYMKKIVLQESTLHPLKHILNKTCFLLSQLVTQITIFSALFNYLTARNVAATPYTIPPTMWIYDYCFFFMFQMV
jgi:hypothetical protein